MLSPSRPRPAEVTSLPAYRMLTDERLAKLAANGNRPAFETIYARYHDTLFRYCRSLVRDDEDARDALQNTMLNAMAAMHRRDRSAPLRPWLFRIAHNESISLLRRRKPQDSLDDDSEPHRELADGRCDVHETAVTHEQLDQLLVDLGELTERQRGALLMRELGGLGYGEIAAALETSEPAVRQSVFAARSALHESAEGRDLSCSSVQMSISGGDRRSIRGRRVSAHLRACSACRDFAGGIGQRRAHYGLLAPGPALAASMLQSVLGAGGGAAAVGVGATAGGSAAAGSVAAKAIVALAAVGAAAGGTVELSKLPERHSSAAHQQVAAAKSRVAAPAASTQAAQRVVRLKANHAPAAHRTAPASLRREAASLKKVSYHWRGAHKDPSGAHPNTKSDPFSPKHRPGVRGGADIRVLLSHTNVTTLAVRLIDRWKAEQDARHRAEIVAELQRRMGTGPAAPAPAAPAPADPAPASAPADSAPQAAPDTATPAESESPPADSGDGASQDSDAPAPSSDADAGTDTP